MPLEVLQRALWGVNTSLPKAVASVFQRRHLRTSGYSTGVNTDSYPNRGVCSRARISQRWEVVLPDGATSSSESHLTFNCLDNKNRNTRNKLSPPPSTKKANIYSHTSSPTITSIFINLILGQNFAITHGHNLRNMSTWESDKSPRDFPIHRPVHS